MDRTWRAYRMASSIAGSYPTRFFLWGEIKRSFYKAPVPKTGDKLRQKILQIADEIKHKLIMIQAAVFSVAHRAHLCLDVNGNHFEHFI